MTTLTDELLTINSIYGDSTLTLEDSSTTTNTTSSTLTILRLPSHPTIHLRLSFPPTYPTTPPSILGTHSVGNDIPKGAGNRLVEVVRRVLDRVFETGVPVVYELVESVREEDVVIEPNKQEEYEANALEEEEEEEEGFIEGRERVRDATYEPREELDHDPPWILSEPITEKKSVFLARVARVDSTGLARSYIAHLIATDKKAAKATHNIQAWRIRGANGTAYQDCDDDGETAAGGRLLHLLQVMDVWDVVVVVSRWYGGVKLGPDRFRLINSAARDGLVRGGFGGEEEGKGKRGKK